MSLRPTDFSVHVASEDVRELLQFCATAFEWTFVPPTQAGFLALAHAHQLVTLCSDAQGDPVGMIPVFHLGEKYSIDDVSTLGGRIVKTVEFGAGVRFAVATGPTGERFGMLGGPVDPRPGHADGTWLELWTTDVQAARAFYAKLFDWTVDASEEHVVFRSADVVLAGLEELDAAFDDLPFLRAIGKVGREARQTQPHWMTYCPAGNLEAAVLRARYLGGRVVLPPTPLHAGGQQAIVTDTRGVFLGLRAT